MREKTVSCCVGCIHDNKLKFDKDVPVICPRLNMPCFAIKPADVEFVLNCHDVYESTTYYDGRIKMNNRFVDDEFIDIMMNAYNELSDEEVKNYKYKAY